MSQFWYKSASFILAVCTVAASQESAIIRGPDIVKAGETVDLEITLDKAPNFEGGNVMVWISGPEGFGVQSGCGVSKGEKVCHYRYTLPADAFGGTWYVSRLAFSAGTRQIEIPFRRVSFLVIANSDLVFPTGAEVAINPSQVQLLRRGSTQLQERIQLLKAAVTEYEQANAKGEILGILRTNLTEAMETLQTTEAQFLKLAADKNQTPVAQVFFGDLRTSYEAALALVDEHSADLNPDGRLLLVASQTHKVHEQINPLLTGVVLRPLEQNELAYKLVSDVGSLVFDLDVNSTPTGAVVSYHRRGDAPKQNPSPTNSTIHSLPYAIWLVRFERPGYRPEEREHDPFREPNHVLTVELRHQDGH